MSASVVELLEQVINYLEISDRLDAEDILSISAKLREALRMLRGSCEEVDA